MSDNSTPHDASDYDREVSRTIPFYHSFHTETVDLVRTLYPDPTLWLDTGCGTGYLPEQALPVFPNTRFLLTDPAPAMLDQARARLARFPSEHICFLGVFSSEELPRVVFESPQVITAIQCHHYGGDKARKRATSACFRLLTEGGLYITFENIRPDTPKGIATGLDRWCRFQREAGRPGETVAEHRSRFGKSYFPITVAEHLDLLGATGFSFAEIFWLSYMQAGFYAIK
jgi:tRNA (cmo5U34)-methyltransferase